jgi:hypothetical protein
MGRLSTISVLHHPSGCILHWEVFDMDVNAKEFEVLDEGRDLAEVATTCCLSGNSAKIK